MKFRSFSRFFARLAAVVLCAALLGGCGAVLPQAASSAVSSSAGTAALKVVCTMFPQYDMIRAIAGERVQLTLMVQPGMEAHGFSPTAQDIVYAKDADLFLLTGGDADEWAQAIEENLDSTQTRTVSLLSCLEEGEPYADEHIWTSPRKCLQLIDSLCALLTEMDPQGAQTYRAGAEAYRERFAALDSDFQTLAQQAEKTVILGDRQPFSCLAADYGLHFVGAFTGCSTDTEVSAETMASLSDLAAAEKAADVFYLELSDPGLCQTLAEASGAQPKLLYSGQAVSQADFAAGLSLADMLAYNLNAITEVQQ